MADQIRSCGRSYILYFFGNKFNMCINDLQGSYEGYAQEIALKKEAKLITNGIM